jgi:hypothetical protein
VLKPFEAASGAGAIGQSLTYNATRGSAVAEEFFNAPDQDAPLALPARMKPILDAAADTNATDVQAEAFAANAGRKEHASHPSATGALLPSAHRPVPASRATRAIGQEANTLIFAADHTYCAAHGVDVDVTHSAITDQGESRRRVRDAREAPADAATASQPGDEPHLPAVDTRLQGPPTAGFAERSVERSRSHGTVPKTATALLLGGPITAEADRPIRRSCSDLARPSAADALLDDVRMATTAWGAPSAPVFVAPDDIALLPTGATNL